MTETEILSSPFAIIVTIALIAFFAYQMGKDKGVEKKRHEEELKNIQRELANETEEERAERNATVDRIVNHKPPSVMMGFRNPNDESE